MNIFFKDYFNKYVKLKYFILLSCLSSLSRTHTHSLSTRLPLLLSLFSPSQLLSFLSISLISTSLSCPPLYFLILASLSSASLSLISASLSSYIRLWDFCEFGFMGFTGCTVDFCEFGFGCLWIFLMMIVVLCG